MMKLKTALWAIAACLLVACGSNTGKTADTYIPQRADYSFRSDVRTVNEDGEVYWDTIIVYLTNAKGLTQELYSQALPLDTISWNKSSIGEILEDDWNFDGIPDLQVCTGPMNAFGNFTYDVWLWNDQTHKFEELDYDGAIYSPYVDPDNKCIVSTWHLDDEVEIVTYKWKDGKLIETERETTTTDLTDLTDE